MVDRPRIVRLLARLEEYVEALRGLSQVPREEFLGDRIKIAAGSARRLDGEAVTMYKQRFADG